MTKIALYWICHTAGLECWRHDKTTSPPLTRRSAFSCAKLSIPVYLRKIETLTVSRVLLPGSVYTELVFQPTSKHRSAAWSGRYFLSISGTHVWGVCHRAQGTTMVQWVCRNVGHESQGQGSSCWSSGEPVDKPLNPKAVCVAFLSHCLVLPFRESMQQFARDDSCSIVCIR
jgi:hypothetical protein